MNRKSFVSISCRLERRKRKKSAKSDRDHFSKGSSAQDQRKPQTSQLLHGRFSGRIGENDLSVSTCVETRHPILPYRDLLLWSVLVRLRFTMLHPLNGMRSPGTRVIEVIYSATSK